MEDGLPPPVKTGGFRPVYPMKNNKLSVGITRSEEFKRNLRESRKDVPRPNMSGEKHPLFGTHLSEQAIQQRTESRSGGYWYGNVKYYEYPVYCELFTEDFKERVRAFFGYICPECGTPQNGKKLAVHHVHYDKKTCCKDGELIGDRQFVPLCITNGCHPKTNHNRPYWEQYFTDMINGYYQGKCYLTKEEMMCIQGVT